MSDYHEYQYNNTDFVSYNATPYNKPSMKSRGRGTCTRSIYNSTEQYVNKSVGERGDNYSRGDFGRGNTGMVRGSLANYNSKNDNDRRRGYGYVGTLNSQTQKQQYKHGGDYKCYVNKTTKSKYYKSKTIHIPIEENEVRIASNGIVQEFVDYCLELLQSKVKNAKQHKFIIISATGREISKAINCCEILKRKCVGLLQQTSIEYKTIREIWEPLELFLKQVIIETELKYIKIILTFDNKLINNKSIGYQQPISWIDLGDARELYVKMSNKINNLQSRLNNMNDIIDGLEDELEGKCDDFNTTKMQSNNDYNKLEAKYDERMDIITQQRKDYNNLTNDIDNLKEKYQQLLSKNEKEIKNKKYDNLNANELVELLINFNISKYEKYKELLLKGCSEEGVDGSCLHELTKDDLYRFGVTQFKDRLGMYNQIKTLF